VFPRQSIAGRTERVHGLVACAAALVVAIPGALLAASPPTLAETGLYAHPPAKRLAADVRPFAPQYALWSDGATKRRWIALPPGGVIDASDPDAWVFPAGTRLWKEFSLGRRIETRFMELGADGDWTYATYRWNEDETEALLVPARGVRRAAESVPGVAYGIPGLVECRACHESASSSVLGFSALQLSPDRDPAALHPPTVEPGSIDLTDLIREGLLVGLPPDAAPRVRAASPTERTALGYLHANCSHCHHTGSPIANLGLFLEVHADGTPEVFRTAVGHASQYRPTGTEIESRIVPGDPAASLVIARVSTRSPTVQMPPMGTHRIDREGVALLTEWIRELQTSTHDDSVENENRPADPGEATQEEAP